MAAVFFASCVLLDAWPADPVPFRCGQFIPNDIHARVDFEILSQSKLDEAIDRAKATTPTTFQLNVPLVNAIVSDLNSLPGKLSAATQPADVDPNILKQIGPIGEDALKAWRTATQPANQKSFTAQLDRLRSALQQTPLVRGSQLDLTSREFYMVSPDGKKTMSVSRLISLDNADDVDETVARLIRDIGPPLRENVATYLSNLFLKDKTKHPLYLIDTAATERDIQERIAAIKADPPKERFTEGEKLVRRSLREDGKIAALSDGEYNLLMAEHRAFKARQREAHPWLKSGQITGRGAILLLVTAMICLYIARSQSAIVADFWRAALLAMLLIVMLGAAKIMYYALQWNPNAVILSVMMATLIILIAYDQRMAFVTSSMLSVLLVFQMRTDFPRFLVLLSAVMAVAFQLREIRRRSRLLEVSAISAVVIFGAVCAVGLASAVPWHFILIDGAWACGFVLLTGFLMQGILPLIERLFGVATSLTLLEWCDASKPLLRRLATEAPGTYSHSLQLGAICEAAAEAIGARGLLARVGAYYHDIGKINKPEYFVENQPAATASRHTKLSPAMSLLIIIGHVKDGIELAKRYKLPAVLHEFITSHHGTTLLQYFYHAAAEQRKVRMERAPDEIEFRYPGPKPRSKECAILMLADAAESSVRSMSEPTVGRIENQVHTMVNRRLMDGQLDECDLTLKEVHQIELSLIKSLCGIYHPRVSYPTPAGQKASAAELLASRMQAQKAAPPPHVPPAGGLSPPPATPQMDDA